MKTKSSFCQAIFAKSSHALSKLRMQHGVSGLGIYICIIEALFDEPEATLPRDYETLAFRFRLSTEEVRSVVEDFNLFEFSNDKSLFYSELLRSQRQPKRKRTTPTPTNDTKPEEETILLPQIYKDPTVQSLPPLTYDQKVALEIQRFMALSIKEQTDLLRNDPEWMKYTAMDFRITETTLLEYLIMYEDYCDTRKDVHYNCSDLKYRFTIWCNNYTRSLHEFD